MPDRIDEIDARLREVERALVELATASRMVRVLVLLVAAGLGIDLTGFGVD